jgi:carbon-monoxide dehydrogenase catalytic subunit
MVRCTKSTSVQRVFADLTEHNWMPTEKRADRRAASTKADSNSELHSRKENHDKLYDIWVISPQGGICEMPNRLDRIQPRSNNINGVDDEAIAALGLAIAIANTTEAHSKQSRRLIEGLVAGIQPLGKARKMDLNKLHAIALRLGIDQQRQNAEETAKLIANEALGDHSRAKGTLGFMASIVTKPRHAALTESGLMPSNIDDAIQKVVTRASSEGKADPMAIVFEGIACSIADYDSMHISTDLSDIVHGTPWLSWTESESKGLRPEAVNVVIDNLDQSLAEKIAKAARHNHEKAIEAGSTGINIFHTGRDPPS